MGKREDVLHLFNETSSKLGGLDILIINHGVQRFHKAEAFPLEDWDTVLEIDLTSMFMLDQLAGKYMLANSGAKSSLSRH